MNLFFSFRRSLSPQTSSVFYLFSAGWAFLNAVGFTLALVYYAQTFSLSAFDMVLLGSALEAACFVFETPTGILADLFSRKFSIVAGLFVTAGAMTLLGFATSFPELLVAQVLWGLGFAFTSGAAAAWIADEVGQDALPKIFQREQQFYLAASILGIVAAGALGLLGLRVPIVCSAAGFLLLAIIMWITIREPHFTPVPKDDRTTLGRAIGVFNAGLSVARRRQVVRRFLVISLIAGLSSEAFDRLWTLRILHDFALPLVAGNRSPELWFTAFALASTFIGLVATTVAYRHASRFVNALHPNAALAVLTGIQILGMLGFALSGNLWLALIAMWIRDAALSIAQPVEAAWLNRNADSESRATVLSMNSQFNAVGQVVGGPPIGAIASATTLRIGLAISAVILVPAAVTFLNLRPAAPHSIDGSNAVDPDQ